MPVCSARGEKQENTASKTSISNIAANVPRGTSYRYADMRAMGFIAVENLLEDTITRSAKSQCDTDGELSWLRKRLDNERRDPRSRGKHPLEGDISQYQPRALLKQQPPVDKENALLSSSMGMGASINKVSRWWWSRISVEQGCYECCHYC